MKTHITFIRTLYAVHLTLLLLLCIGSGQLQAQGLTPNVYLPAINATVAPTTAASIQYNTQATLGKGSGNITVYAGGAVFESIPVSSANVVIYNNTSPAGKTVVIKFNRPLPDGVPCYINVPGSAFITNANGGFNEIFNSWNFNTSPSGPILYKRTPEVGSLLTPAEATTLTLEFHENITKGTGSILLKDRSSGSVLQTINVTSSAVTVPANSRLATITLAAPLPQNTQVGLELPAGVFRDAGGTNSLQVIDENTWFSIRDVVPPALVSTTPVHQSTINFTDRTVTLTFDGPIVKGTGNFTFINKATNASIYSAGIYGSDVTYSGNTITIQKSTNWPAGINIGVQAPATVVQDAAGNFWPGLPTGNEFSFSTCAAVTPTVSIAVTAGTNPTCAGTAITFTATTTNGGSAPTYQWRVNGVNAGTNSPTFTSSTLTHGQVVSCVVTSNAPCLTTPTATSNSIAVGITSQITPTITITGSSTVCQGNSVTFNAAVTNEGSNPTYQWKVNGTNVGTNQNFFTTSTLTNGQVVTCELTRQSGACITTTSATSNAITVTVNQVPNQPSTITGNTTVCQGTTQTYSITNVSGVTYTWDTGGGGTITGTGNSVSITWTSAGTKTLIVYPSNSCGGGTPRTLQVVVNAMPAQPSTIAGANVVNLNTSNQFSVTNEPGTTYSWNGGTGATITGTGNAVSISWSSFGAKTITVTPSNACGTGTARTLSITVDNCAVPAQPSVISGSASACINTGVSYSVDAVGGVSFAWDAGAGGTVTGSGNSVTLNWTTSGTKTVTVTPFNACGNGMARTLTVTVNQLPAQPSVISGNTTICQNATAAYSVTNVSGTTYAWDTGGKGTVTGSGNSVNITWTMAGTNVLTVTPTTACGTGAARTLTVTVTTVPSGTSGITGSIQQCTGISSAYAVTNVAGVTYAWNAGTGGVVTGSGNSVNISWSSGGEKTITVTPSNACGNGVATTLTVSVGAAPAQPSAITGATSLNTGSTGTYSITPVAGVTYTWTSSADATLVGTGNSIQATWTTAGTKTLTVTPANACNNGTPRTLNVVVSAPCVTPDVPNVIITNGGGSNQFVNQTRRMQVTFSNGASSYNLTVFPTTGVTIVPVSGNTWDVTFASAGEFTVSGTGVSACGTSAPGTLAINVCALALDPPTSVTGPTENICAGTTTRYTVSNPLEGLSYDWNLGGATGVTIAYLNPARSVADITWATDWAAVNVTVRSRNICNTTSTLGTTVSVNLAAAPTTPSISTSPGGAICAGNSVTYTITNPQAGVDYNWILNGSGTIAGNKLSATALADGQARTIKVVATKACYVNYEVNSISFGGGTPQPALPSPIVAPATLNVDVDGNFSVDAQPAGINFSWSATGGTITNTANQNVKLIRWSTGGTKTISVNTSNSCGISATRNYSIYVTGPCTNPTVPSSITGSSSGCVNAEYTFSVPYQPGTTYNWTAGADATLVTSGTQVSIKWTTAGSKTISVTATNDCSTSAAQTKAFTVLATPAQPAAITGGSQNCVAASETFQVAPVGGLSYVWEVQGGTFTTAGSQNEQATITWTSTGTNTIRVRASNSCGFSSERTLDRTVNTVPTQPGPVIGVTELCVNASASFSITNVSGVTYAWAGGTGATVTGSGNAVTIAWNSTGSKTITVTPSNACGAGTARTLSVNVISSPAQPSAITGNAAPTLGSSQAYSVTSVAGVNYTWALSDKGTLTNSGSTANILWNTAGTATVSVTPSNTCGSGPVRTLAVTIGKQAQTITFNLASPVVANAQIALSASSTSNLAVTFASSNNSVAEVQGNALVIKNTGTVTITASQAGDETFAAASPVARSLTINKANQVITFPALAARTFTTPAFGAGATIDSDLPITYSSSNPAVATISTTGLITITGVGSTNLTAAQGGDALYNAATSVVRSLTVNKADQTITFLPIAAKSISDPPFVASATVSSGLPISFTSTNEAVAIVVDGTIYITGMGTTTLTASQAGNANFNAAASVQQSLTVSGKQNQTITFPAIASKNLGDAPFTLNATASSGLSITYTSSNTAIATVSGNTVTLLTSGSVTIHANQPGDATFNPATQVSQTFCVNPAKPVITASGLNTETPVLSSSSAAGNQWFRNNDAIAGATNPTLNVTEPGVYKVRVNAGSCTSAFSDDFAIIVTGDLQPDAVHVSVAPNPTYDRINVLLPDDQQLRDVVLVSLQGQRLQQVSTRAASLQIDVQHIAPGTYLLQVSTGKATQSIRIIKK